MALNKLRKLDRSSAGVTLPKDDLRLEGLLDEDGDLEGEHHVHIRHVDDGEWSLTLVDEIDDQSKPPKQGV
ncbi:hypothetical protein [Natrinema versiforme]|uniref:DUF8053 domain-containing protein n=1 Tax=Natrinema versiforme TaxID=88724 RepID=A0A4P8WL95_9EURY|nr:hypothetical protein [Natrinema versiforme]QCS44095.1 hypothetical protein FEJ81_17755 [Natrinema versiforme]